MAPRLLLSVCLALLETFAQCRTPAAAQTPASYQGIYVVIDPYNTQHVGFLQTAAASPCPQDPANPISPFCGAANGILLRINWCDFQLYHVANPAGGTWPSCHYTVGVASGATTVSELAITDTISPCPGLYDTCAGGSVLGATLALVAQIDANRAAAGLPPLLLSVGLAAGSFTAQTVLDQVGTLDLPISEGQPSSGQTQEECMRLPLPWKPAYLPAFDTALSTLLTTIVQTLGPQNAAITILKPASLGAASLEINVPGRTSVFKAPADPGPGGPGAALACPTSQTGAKLWLTAYNKSKVKGETFSQAFESVFGGTIGYALGTLQNLGYPNTLLSIPTNNSTGLAAVDCGASGAGTCTAQSQTKVGNYSLYYMDTYIDDLFSNGLAEQAAASAWGGLRGGTFALPASQVSVDSTALSPQPPVSATLPQCTLNNTSPTEQTPFVLDGATVNVLGQGTGLAFQTLFNSGPDCAAGTYGTTLQNGIADGALFEEVETDAAFTDLPACTGYLAGALTQLLAAVPPTVCAY